jgi:gamma-glutamylcyclotransferase (GGCT)/AIG2-like uncharacterized protein YtfP
MSEQYLFVYGTLMAATRHPMAMRLARESRLVGNGTIRGRLYDLGAYPALVETGEGDGEVHGEVRALNSPAASLPWLDAYEGIVPGRDSDYERVERRVRLEDGRALTAWVYLYRKPVTGRRLIESGSWLAHTAARRSQSSEA